MVVLFMIDLQHRILPNVITLPGIVVGLAFSLVLPPGLRDALIGAVACSLILFGMGELVSRVLGKDALGFGDVKMIAMMGAFLGWQLTLVALFLASFLGSVIGIGLVALTRDRDYQIPLGSFLAIGAVAAAVAGEPLLDLVCRAHVPAVVISMNQQAFALIRVCCGRKSPTTGPASSPDCGSASSVRSSRPSLRQPSPRLYPNAQAYSGRRQLSVSKQLTRRHALAG